MVQLVLWVLLDHLDFKAHQDSLEQLEAKDQQDQSVSLVYREMLAHQAHLELLGNKEELDFQDQLDLLGNQDLLDNQDLLVTEDHLVRMVSQEIKDLRVTKDPQVLPAVLEHLDKMELLERREIKDNLETKDQRERLAMLALLVNRVR